MCKTWGGGGVFPNRDIKQSRLTYQIPDPGDRWPILTLQNGGAEGPDAKYLVSRIIADLSVSTLFFCLSV